MVAIGCASGQVSVSWRYTQESPQASWPLQTSGSVPEMCCCDTGVVCMQELVDLVAQCLAKEPCDRPGAVQLLKHRFLRVGTNPNSFLTCSSMLNIPAHGCSHELQLLVSILCSRPEKACLIV